jgi:3-hydroxyisobutyrate dehydrogenase-like beta-hydroxyacid dehydrogenase
VTSGAVPRPAMVGLGNLGGRMVIRLASTGAQVVGHDVRPGQARVLGIADAGSLAAACGERDVVDEDGRVATLVADLVLDAAHHRRAERDRVDPDAVPRHLE